MDGAGGVEPDYLQKASTVTADGYNCEVSIPYGQMPSLDFSAGNTIGFHPVFDDTDNGDTELQMSWTGREAHDQSLGYGHLFLSSDSAPVVDMEIGFATQPPVLDGEVDEIWADASTQYFVPLDDPANASGSWKVLYDSENLYVLVDMTDDSLQNDSASSWQDDSVEVYFDGGNTKVNTPLSGDDHQYTFGWTTDDIQGTNIDGATEGIEHAQVTTDTGWRIEIKMPWLSIQGIEPQARDLIGIDLYYNDDDDGGDSRENKLLSFSAIEGWNDASQWGTAMLIAEPEPEPVDPGTNGLVAYYAFENDANDSSGNELHGTLVGDAKFAEGPAGYGMALDLDGDGDYVDCGTPSQLDITEQITFTYWIKAVALDKGWNTVLSRGDDSWRSSRAGTENFMEAAVGGTSGNYLFGATLVDDDNWHHVGAVYDGETFSLYVDGKLDGSEESTGSITVSSYPLFIGNNSQNTDREWTGLIDEVVIYDRALSAGEIRYLAGERATPVDVTAPGDIVKGVPDDGDWPGAETPDLATDDDTSTKYLHFKGETEPTGFQVTPSAGPTIVTGLTLTTANDAAERDPIAFELYGSNVSIDGPYELIASGDIVDFAQADAWPRFTMNTTPISFDNDVAYKYYQVMFPTVRDAASANSMQIAEVELLGVVKPTGVNIILVSGNHDFDIDGVVDDFMLVDILKAEGHTVDYQPGNWTELDDDKIAALNAADLVIISRCTNSGDYAADDTEVAQWNSITTPMLSISTHLARSSRWKWLDSTSLLDLVPAVMELADGTQIDAMDEAVGLSSFIDAAPGNGTVLATGDGLPWIIEWEAGVEYYDGAGQIAGGPRVFFVAGTQELEGVSNWGEWNLTPEGKTIFLNTVNMMLPQ
jgi:hypothetical protein